SPRLRLMLTLRTQRDTSQLLRCRIVALLLTGFWRRMCDPHRAWGTTPIQAPIDPSRSGTTSPYRTGSLAQRSRDSRRLFRPKAPTTVGFRRSIRLCPGFAPTETSPTAYFACFTPGEDLPIEEGPALQAVRAWVQAAGIKPGTPLWRALRKGHVQPD